jgi:predicted RNA methylase
MANKKTDTVENSLEKFYTPTSLTNEIIDEINTFIHFNPSEILEPTAGSGMMLDVIKERYDVPIKAFDILNETKRLDIVENNYLKTKIEYVPNRLVIANPPFHLGLKMLYKMMSESDFVACILSQTSIISFDFDKYDDEWEVHTIWAKKKQRFDRVKVNISVFFLERRSKI